MEEIKLTRVNNDGNGNPRYVCHFLALINDKNEADVCEDFAASLAINPMKKTSFLYDAALDKAKKIGGRKYHTKAFGGGIVFQSHNVNELQRQLQELQKL